MSELAFENHDTTSFLSVEPTLIADDTHAGADRFDVDPLFPAATTAATPIERRLSMIGLYGWSSHGAANPPPPRLMLTATICRAAATAYTRSSAAMTSEL